MRSDALQERQGVAHAVRRSRGELGRIEERVDRDNLLEQRGHDAEGVPEDQSQLRDLLSLLAQLEQSSLARVLVQQVCNVRQRSPVVL